MKKTNLIVLVLFLITVPIFAKKLTIAGSTTVLPIAQAAAEVFMENNAEANISVRGGGSSIGIAGILSGTIDIGDASRHAKTKEKAQARERGIKLYENIIAADGIAIIVHPSNKITNISMQQLQDIFAGKITNWKELGGKNEPLVAILRDPSSGTYEVFDKLVMQGTTNRSDALSLGSNNAVVSTVKNTPGAIGYAGLGYLNNSVKTVKVENVIATESTVNSKKYPISRTLHMYTNGAPKGLAKQYIDFILSAEGQNLVEELGFIKLQ